MRSPAFIDRWRRRWFGTYSIDDPRPIAAGAPYTYFLPSENELLALAPGDQAKIVFRSHPAGREWDAERMWVSITAAGGEALIGTLGNDPFDMPQLRCGATIKFKRSDVIGLIWGDSRTVPPPPSPERRDYWDRCWVDACVVENAVKVHYLYREEPEVTPEGDRYADSGWRIRGDYRETDDDELGARKVRYLALGAVLNRDDSWLHLIDAPVGAAYLRDWDNDGFVADD